MFERDQRGIALVPVYVQYVQDTISSYHSGEQYGDWSAEYDFRVTGVSLTPRDRYSEEKLGLPEVKAGDVVYVLWMTYSSGDSFGSSSGNGEVLWVFKDATLALRAKQKFEAAEDAYQIEIEADDGVKFVLSNPAAGYFENMGFCEVSTFLVNP